jgi:radical SAM superfamily enzyme YgiQ (UPF0313 family)
MKVRYIAPRNPLNTIFMPDVLKRLTFRRKALFIPLNLCVCAALTPREHEVDIVDECVEEVNFDEPVDLVGITSITSTAPRAYEIADEYRRRGVKVVLGGTHPSALPDEAASHADAVVVGEAEATLPALFDDFKAGRLKPLYRAEEIDENSPIATPRRDLIPKKNYLVYNAVQTSRGCPHRCTFCTTYALYGKRYRTRPVEDVVSEIRSIGGKTYIFADDNALGNRKWAKELLRALVPLHIHWAGQATVLVADDDELLALLRRSGCRGLVLGLESTSQQSLLAANKNFADVADYLPRVRKLQSYGIQLWGSFLFGFDSDTVRTCMDSVRFACKAELAMSCYPVLTPYPGTSVYEELEREGRLLTKDWSKYNGANVVFQPKNMTAEELHLCQIAAFGDFYSLGAISRRLGFFPFKKWSWIANLAIWQAIRYYYRKRKKHLPTGKELLKAEKRGRYPFCSFVKCATASQAMGYGEEKG